MPIKWQILSHHDLVVKINWGDGNEMGNFEIDGGVSKQSVGI
jgi:hypothetical protein